MLIVNCSSIQNGNSILIFVDKKATIYRVLARYNINENKILPPIEVNPWRRIGKEDIILGAKGEMSEAHLGKGLINGIEKDLILLKYRLDTDRIKEGLYLRSLQQYKGIPRIFYESNNVIVTERLYPIPSGQPLNIICAVGFKMVNLMETLYNNGIYHNHLDHAKHGQAKLGILHFTKETIFIL